jgi:Protein of unknown function (DUF3780)
MSAVLDAPPARRKTSVRARATADAAVIDTRSAVLDAKARVRAAVTVGFGCPPMADWPHHIVVAIPAGRGGDIRIVENHGILGHSDPSEDMERCVLPRARWNTMADLAKAELNARLREKGLPTSRWQPGDNRIERILGTELLTLAWAVAAANEADVPAVVSAWVSLQSSERLWLAGRVLASSSECVRRGLALLLSGGPVTAEIRDKPPSRYGRVIKGAGGLSLFDVR